MEIVAAVAIIAVLCGVAIPTVINSRKSLNKQQEFNYSKSVYLAAQDNLAAMKINGSIKKLIKNDDSFHYVYNGSGELVAEIDNLFTGDYSILKEDLLNNDVKKEYYYTKINDEAFLTIVPPTSVDSTIFDGNTDVTVVFNIKTGDVLFVGYGKDGKYSGKVVNSLDEITPEKQTANVSIINGNECILKIAVPTSGYGGINEVDNLLNNLVFDITISDLSDEGKYFSYSISPSDENPDIVKKPSVDTSVINWTLDSLIPGHSFGEKNNASSNRSDDMIPLGNDIQAAVHFSIKPECRDYDIDIDDVSCTGNPLFAGITETDGTTSISIANGRNLQNLNKIDRGLAAALVEKSQTEKVTVNLTKDISWADAVRDCYKKIEKNPTAFNGVVFRSNFNPLVDDTLFCENSGIEFVGNGKKIYNLFIQENQNENADAVEGHAENDDYNAGLFSNLYVNVSGINFIDPIVSGKDNVGVLAGRANGSEINEVNVTVKTNSRNVTQDVFDGTQAADISSMIFGATFIGSYGGDVDKPLYASTGFIVGEADNCTIMNSEIIIENGFYTPSSSDNFGLICGYSKGSNISGCYVSGTIIGGKAHLLGGAVGKIEGGICSDIKLDTNYQNIGCWCFGGAVGGVYGGTVKNIRCSGDININTTYKLNDIFGEENLKDYGTYACPSEVGYAGKFVGYIESGEFKDNIADFTSYESSANGVHYENMQFVGVVKCNQGTISDAYTSTQKETSLIKAQPVSFDNNADSFNNYLGNYESTDSSLGMIFEKRGDVFYYNYSDVSLSGCKYKDRNGTLKKQEITEESAFYFYNRKKTSDPKTGEPEYQTEIKFDNSDVKGGTEFLITDSSGKYLMSVEKVLFSDTKSAFPGDEEIQQPISAFLKLWKDGMLYRYVSDHDLSYYPVNYSGSSGSSSDPCKENAILRIWDSQKDRNDSLENYYMVNYHRGSAFLTSEKWGIYEDYNPNVPSNTGEFPTNQWNDSYMNNVNDSPEPKFASNISSSLKEFSIFKFNLKVKKIDDLLSEAGIPSDEYCTDEGKEYISQRAYDVLDDYKWVFGSYNDSKDGYRIGYKKYENANSHVKELIGHNYVGDEHGYLYMDASECYNSVKYPTSTSRTKQFVPIYRAIRDNGDETYQMYLNVHFDSRGNAMIYRRQEVRDGLLVANRHYATFTFDLSDPDELKLGITAVSDESSGYMNNLHAKAGVGTIVSASGKKRELVQFKLADINAQKIS